MSYPLTVTEEQLLERLKSEEERKLFVKRVKRVLDWVMINPENSDNMAYSPVKESVRGHLTAAWEGF